MDRNYSFLFSKFHQLSFSWPSDLKTEEFDVVDEQPLV